MDDAQINLKHREIVFRGPYAPGREPQDAVFLLTGAAGIVQAHSHGGHRISISYDLAIVTLMQLETALSESGFHLDNSLMTKLRRALYYYTEDIERKNHGLQRLTCSRGCAAKIFANSYKNREHGCRDQRPEHLRRYL
jgi:hypothetical protein